VVLVKLRYTFRSFYVKMSPFIFILFITQCDLGLWVDCSLFCWDHMVSIPLAGTHSVEGFKEGGGVVGVRSQRYMVSFWPTD